MKKTLTELRLRPVEGAHKTDLQKPSPSRKKLTRGSVTQNLVTLSKFESLKLLLEGLLSKLPNFVCILLCYRD